MSFLIILLHQVPLVGVCSSRLAYTADLQTGLSLGSTSNRSRSFRSFLTHSSQVFRGRPQPLFPSTFITLTDAIGPSSGDLQTCPYQRSLLVPAAEEISSSPSNLNLYKFP